MRSGDVRLAQMPNFLRQMNAVTMTEVTAMMKRKLMCTNAISYSQKLVKTCALQEQVVISNIGKQYGTHLSLHRNSLH